MEDQDAELPVNPCKSTRGGPLPYSTTWKSMPLARTTVISMRDPGIRSQRIGNGCPNRAMLVNVPVAIGDNLDD